MTDELTAAHGLVLVHCDCAGYDGVHYKQVPAAALSPVAPQAGTGGAGETNTVSTNLCRGNSHLWFSGATLCHCGQRVLEGDASRPAAPADGERVAVMLPRETVAMVARLGYVPQGAHTTGPIEQTVVIACRAALSKEDGSRE